MTLELEQIHKKFLKQIHHKMYCKLCKFSNNHARNILRNFVLTFITSTNLLSCQCRTPAWCMPNIKIAKIAKCYFNNSAP